MQPTVPINNGGVGPATQAAQASGKPSTLGMKPDNLIVDRLVGVCALVPVRKIFTRAIVQTLRLSCESLLAPARSKELREQPLIVKTPSKDAAI